MCVSNTTCPACQFPISENFFFCPNCGKKIKEAPISVSIEKQIGIYALSVLLPPLGLWPGIKYLREKDSKVRTVGIIAIALTIISIAFTLWISVGIFSQVNQGINSQLQGYPGL